MAYQMHAIDIDDAFREQGDSLFNTFYNVHHQTGPGKDAMRFWIPTRFGEGHLDLRKLADATFSLGTTRFNRDVNLSDNVASSIFSIRINTGADASFRIDNTAFSVASQTTSLRYFQQGANYQRQFSRNEKVGDLAFTFTEEQFHQYLESLEHPELSRAVDRADYFQLFCQAKIDAKQRYLIAKLTNNPYKGALEKLYFDSVAGELLIAALGSLGVDNNSAATAACAVVKLSAHDREMLLYAEELLLQDMRNPPTISALAKSVGLNENKLKRGFKQVFNNTIFKTLNEYRMQHAAELVKKNEMSIAEIANETGYANVSKFIAAFKRNHGVTPGTMRSKTSYSLPAAPSTSPHE